MSSRLCGPYSSVSSTVQQAWRFHLGESHIWARITGSIWQNILRARIDSHFSLFFFFFFGSCSCFFLFLFTPILGSLSKLHVMGCGLLLEWSMHHIIKGDSSNIFKSVWIEEDNFGKKQGFVCKDMRQKSCFLYDVYHFL